jgi:acyl-[acyl carrier protein]--UDP-N-acetylglucosamine O-acyltransferase
LKRKGFSIDSRKALKQLWHRLNDPKLPTTEAVELAREELGGQPEVALVLDFIASAKRGVILG